MSKYKYRVGAGLAFSRTKDIDTFSSMAQKGYRPIHLNKLGVYKFEPCDPEKVMYAADYSGVDQKSPDFTEYCEVFKSSGWEFVYGKGGANFFKAPLGTVPLYTDKQGEANMYLKMAKDLIPYIAAMLVLFSIFVVCINVIGRVPIAIWLWAFAGSCFGVTAMLLYAFFSSRHQAKMVLSGK